MGFWNQNKNTPDSSKESVWSQEVRPDLTFEKIELPFHIEPNIARPQPKVSGKNVVLKIPIRTSDLSDRTKILTFHDVLLYRAGSPNDEGMDYATDSRMRSDSVYYHKHFPEIKPSTFYKVQGWDWKNYLFVPSAHIVNKDYKKENEREYTHYVYFMKDGTFECIAKGFHAYPEEIDTSLLTYEEKEILADFHKRRAIFDEYLKSNEIKLKTCPGCGYPELSERGAYEICSVCDWEDDNQDDNTADEIWGGPNGRLSLTENRLAIGRFLKELMSETGSQLNDSPKEVLPILDQRGKEIAEFSKSNEMGKKRWDDPVWQEWRELRKFTLRNLMKKPNS